MFDLFFFNWLLNVMQFFFLLCIPPLLISPKYLYFCRCQSERVHDRQRLRGLVESHRRQMMSGTVTKLVLVLLIYYGKILETTEAGLSLLRLCLFTICTEDLGPNSRKESSFIYSTTWKFWKCRTRNLTVTNSSVHHFKCSKLILIHFLTAICDKVTFFMTNIPIMLFISEVMKMMYLKK